MLPLLLKAPGAVTALLATSCLLGCLILPTDGIEWLGVAHLNRAASLALTDAKVARRYGLNQQRVAQLRVASGGAATEHLLEASRLTMDACQETFRDSRWNCSSIRQLPAVVPVELTLGTREQAYVYALSSAMLTYYVAQACACGCGGTSAAAANAAGAARQNEALRTAKRDAATFHWNGGGGSGGGSGGGCNAKVDYALKFAERFTDSPLRKSRKLLAAAVAANENGNGGGGSSVAELPLPHSLDAAALVNLHNNAVGRQVVRDAKTSMCRCQGVSGSCTVKTCTHEVDKVKIVSALRDKYNRAVLVRRRQSPGSASAAADLARLLGGGDRSGELVFYGLSPDYCLPDQARGSAGTRDRVCGDGTKDNCDSLCCRRGYRTRHYVTNDRCNCRYLWCCSVECDVCHKNVTELVCN